MTAVTFPMAIMLLLSLPLSILSSSEYCATISGEEASGASGYVALKVGDGSAQYAFDLDLSDFSTTCDLTNGLTYHVHSFWNNGTTVSSADDFCGSSYTGGHYDPNFACSGSSQSASDQCVSINRTASQGYTYSCSTSNYDLGRYSFCEVGDISGKVGTAFPTNSDGTKFSLGYFEDFLPVYAANYDFQDDTSLMWISWVFHCAETGARLVCAKFSTDDLSSCKSKLNSSKFSSSSGSSKKCDDDDDEDNIGAAVGIFVALIIVSILMGCGIGYFVRGYLASRNGGEQNNMFGSQQSAMHTAY